MILHYRNSHRRGVVLMVVLAMLTLFAAVGLAFVSYTESEATQAQNQKLSEAVRLPDADIVFNQAMRQLVFGTADNGSALYTHSLLTDMYGLATGTNFQNRIPYTGTGALSVRDPSGVLDLSATVSSNARYSPNFQGRTYDESVFGSRNPPYTYANHDHIFLGAWSNTGNGNEVVARSFVRDGVIRIQFAPMPGLPDFIDYAFNPYNLSNAKMREFWSWTPAAPAAYSFDLPIPDPPAGRTYQQPPVYGGPGAYVRRFFVIPPTIDHNNDRNILRAMVMRPGPWDHFKVSGGIASPSFPPPGDFGGDIKNLPPDLKTVVTYLNNTAPLPSRVTGNADSIWTDCNFPTLTATNGKKYKPLASWFITDMEGMVNLSVAGNRRGVDPVTGATAHSSSVGLAPYDINPEKVLPSAAVYPDVSNLFAGRALVQNSATNTPLQVEYARYGYVYENPPTNPALRDPATQVTNYSHLLRPAPFYGNYNLDGTNDGFAGYAASSRHVLSSLLIDRFPKQNGQVQGYNNGTGPEAVRGGAFRSPLYNSALSPYFPGLPYFYRAFSPQNLEAMYRRADVGADALESELRRLLPNAFTDPAILRRLTTTSYDLNRAPFAPWVNDFTDVSKQLQFLTATDVRPVGQPINYPGTPPVNPAAPPPTSDYYPGPLSPTTTWRSILAALPRLDLNRPLPDYPPCPQGRPDLQIDLTNPFYAAAVQQAILARQELARDIFFRFILVTNAVGAQDLVNLLENGTPLNVAVSANPNAEDALRWLAQLSVNIVDYIDNDDYVTPFDWYAALGRGAVGAQFVYGTELPRLQINEVYVEAVNDPSDVGGKATHDYGANHWIELYNPLTSQASPGFNAWNDGPNVRFTIGGQQVYQLVITATNNVSNIRNRDNATGNVNAAPVPPPAPPNTVVTVPIMGYPPPTNPAGSVRTNGDIAPGDDNYARTNPLPIVNPAGVYGNQTFSAVGFYLIGPSNFATASATPMQVDESNAALAIASRFSYNSPDQAAQIATNPGDWQAVLLRRLACPYLPYNPAPPDPGYVATYPVNPYITIDYAEKVIPNNAIQFSGTGNNTAFQPPNSRRSIGKPQPYASQWQLWRKADPLPLYADGSTPQHTLLRHNGRSAAGPTPGTASPDTETIKVPFEWLVHLDRPVMSPAELLQISGYKPHELTQQFVATPPTPPTPQYTLPVPVAVGPQIINIPARGVVGGIPWTMQVGDLVLIVDGPPYDPTAVREWVCVTNVAPDYSNFTVTFSQAHPAGAAVLVSIPHAQAAPWFVADDASNAPTPPYTNSAYRIYRLLDMVAVRNPQVEMGQGRMFISSVTPNAVNTGVYDLTINPIDPNTNLPNLSPYDMPLVAPNGAILDISDGTAPGASATVLAYNGGAEYVRVIGVSKDTNKIQAAFLNQPQVGGTLDITYHGGRQPGRINLNTLYDQEVFQALLDRKPINVFTDTSGNDVGKEFQRLYAARQKTFFTDAVRPMLGGLRNVPDPITGYNTVQEDTPLLPLSAGDAPNSGLGIGRTMLQPASNNTIAENGTTAPRLDPRNRLFETGFYENPPGTFTPITNPLERFDVLSKLYNNATTRSNTFAVWLTIGFFEVDDSGVLGAELNQVDGRNTRYRFFAVVDRSVLDEWFAAMNWMVDPTKPAANALITTTSIDPRYTSDINTAAICQTGQYINLGGPWQLTLNINTNYSQFSVGQIVQVTGMIPNPNGPNPPLVPQTENTQVLTVAANVITVRLRYGKQFAIAGGNLVVKQLPVPPTVLYWSQIK